MKILDGPMGTELAARGVATPAPAWSAHALEAAPEVVSAIHREYVAAGARYHRGNTFRAQPRISPSYRALVQRAYRLVRDAVVVGAPQNRVRCRLVGSMAPIEDCYRPDLSPAEDVARAQHREVASALADAGFDMIVCETFPHAGEAVIAVEEAAETGLEVWAALTAGPDGALMTPEAMESAARDCVTAGATAVLVCCTSAKKTLAYVDRLARVDVPFGAYANAGEGSDGLGWLPHDASSSARAAAASRYADLAESWTRAGATLLGACCGCAPSHITELTRRWGP